MCNVFQSAGHIARLRIGHYQRSQLMCLSYGFQLSDTMWFYNRGHYVMGKGVLPSMAEDTPVLATLELVRWVEGGGGRELGRKLCLKSMVTS